MQKVPLVISTFLAMILSIYIYNFELKSEAEVMSFNKFILPFEPADVLAIEIKNKDTQLININRDSKIWRIVKPFPCRANQELIDSIANQLPKLPRIYSIPQKEQKALKEYGLEKPLLAVVVTFRDQNIKKNITRTLSFGLLTGSKNEVFAKADADEHIYLLPAFFLFYLRISTIIGVKNY